VDAKVTIFHDESRVVYEMDSIYDLRTLEAFVLWMYTISRGRLIEEQGAVFGARHVDHYNRVQNLRVQRETSKHN